MRRTSQPYRARCAAFAVALMLTAAAGCGGSGRQGVVFDSGAGILEIAGASPSHTELRLLETLPGASRAPLTNYITPMEGSKSSFFELWLGSADGGVTMTLSGEIRSPGRYRLVDDPAGEGSIVLHLLLDPACEGGDKGSAPGCRWFSSQFFHRNCSLDMTDAGRQKLAGTLSCEALGANCRDTVQGVDGACAGPPAIPAIRVALSFSVFDPRPNAVVPRANRPERDRH